MYRDLTDFKKGYQPRTNVTKDEKGDLVTDSQSASATWRNNFSHLLIVRVDVWQTEIHTAEPQMPESSAF